MSPASISNPHHQLMLLVLLGLSLFAEGAICGSRFSDAKRIRMRDMTSFFTDGKPFCLTKGEVTTISTNYSIKGDENAMSMSYKKIAEDSKTQSVILCADEIISLTMLSCDKELGLVRCRCEDSSLLSEREDVNLPGVIIDLPILTAKDKGDILKWGVPHKIDMIALSFVRKGSDLVEARKVLGEHAKTIMLMSKVGNKEGVANFYGFMVANSDAFMVARGDLGMEIPIERSKNKISENVDVQEELDVKFL